ncbi:hypothetical protein C8Q78DRAFT_475087 [Trametes maxima]|nr:hypothetical protein C8Q78DRAFT_475087 [Trametes maxima]
MHPFYAVGVLEVRRTNDGLHKALGPGSTVRQRSFDTSSDRPGSNTLSSPGNSETRGPPESRRPRTHPGFRRPPIQFHLVIRTSTTVRCVCHSLVSFSPRVVRNDASQSPGRRWSERCAGDAAHGREQLPSPRRQSRRSGRSAQRGGDRSGEGRHLENPPDQHIVFHSMGQRHKSALRRLASQPA